MSIIDPTRRPERQERKPEMIGAKPADNVIFRVYTPPIPAETDADQIHRWRAVREDSSALGVSTYRDFRVTKVELWQDGSMVLHSMIKTGSVTDLRPEAEIGDTIESWMALIVAVVDPSGHIRGESIVLGPEASEQAEPGVN